jgi:hypothetical protein
MTQSIMEIGHPYASFITGRIVMVGGEDWEQAG